MPRQVRPAWWRRLTSRPFLTEVSKFLLIGGAGFVTDVGVFTLLRLESLDLLVDEPLTAKVVSAAVATCVTWLGNRSWTWRHRETASTHRELVLFVVMNVIGIGISLLCLAVSHYVLGFQSLLADNIAANGVGLVLGTAFRFASYRYVVFRDVRPTGERGGRDGARSALELGDVPPSEELLAPGHVPPGRPRP